LQTEWQAYKSSPKNTGLSVFNAPLFPGNFNPAIRHGSRSGRLLPSGKSLIRFDAGIFFTPNSVSGLRGNRVSDAGISSSSPVGNVAITDEAARASGLKIHSYTKTRLARVCRK
jgi:hypothetical protein